MLTQLTYFKHSCGRAAYSEGETLGLRLVKTYRHRVYDGDARRKSWRVSSDLTFWGQGSHRVRRLYAKGIGGPATEPNLLECWELSEDFRRIFALLSMQDVAVY